MSPELFFQHAPPSTTTTVPGQPTTSTTEVPRVVGDPLPEWQTVGAGIACLVLIVVLGLLVNRRRRAAGDI